MYNIITAVPMRLSRFFRLKPIVRWVSRHATKLHSIHSLSIPTIKYYDKLPLQNLQIQAMQYLAYSVFDT